MATLPACKLEHFGINVIDIDRMQRFYSDMFGFIVNDRGVRFNGQRVVFLTKSPSHHHELVLIEGRPADALYNPINQISFVFGSLDDLRICSERLTAAGVTGIMQVNHGNAWSLYARDPEGNPLELFTDSPWHTPQPCKGDLDISRPTADILRETEELCRGREGFMLRAQWIAKVEERFRQAVEAV